MRGGSKLSVRQLAQLALLTALITGGKEAMAALPNINPVTLLLLVTVICYGCRALYVVLAFIMLEVGLYGLGLWTFQYLIAWPLLVMLALPFRDVRSPLFWGAFAGIFGLSFGAITALPYLFAGGWGAALAYWVAGIPFDLVHGVFNAVLTYALILPLTDLMKREGGQAP